MRMRLGYGCGGLMREPSARKRQRLLACAYDLGIRHFDVARMYGLGRAEVELGHFIHSRRDQVTVTSKCGIDVPDGVSRWGGVQDVARWVFRHAPFLKSLVQRHRGPSLYTKPILTPAYLAQSLETSLKALNTPYLDCYLVHEPEYAQLNLSEMESVLDSFCVDGRVRSYGIAGFWAQISPFSGASTRLASTVQCEAFSPLRRTDFMVLDQLFIFGMLSQGLPRLRALDGSRLRALSEIIGRELSDPSEQIRAIFDYMETQYQGATLVVSSTDEAHLTQLATYFDGRKALSVGAFEAMERVFCS